jgi:DNA-binding NarL/FixJ family response regulator
MLIEDSLDYRKTLAMAIAREKDIELTSQFGIAEEALRSLEDMSNGGIPDVILLDLGLPGISGIEAIPLFAKIIPNPRIIVLTQSDREADVVAAISAGASGYLLKGATRQQIFDGIRTVFNGGAMIDQEVALYIVNALRTRPETIKLGKQLSQREISVLSLLASGLVQKEISNQLQISSHTVSTYIRRIYEKLNVQNAPAAVAKAYRDGIFPLKGTGKQEREAG